MLDPKVKWLIVHDDEYEPYPVGYMTKREAVADYRKYKKRYPLEPLYLVKVIKGGSQ